jgi:membrane-bound metal-dependent hydrolase YbcI (DUF457 family)
MPSPVGHGLAGLTVHVLVSRNELELRNPRRLALTVGAALAPDIDLLFRFVDGRNHHNHETHSIGLAIAAGVLVGLLAWLRRWERPFAFGAASGLAWASHVLLDYLNVDTSPPIGIMALWPFESGFHKFPWPLFLDIGRKLDWATLQHDAVAAVWEATVLLPVLLGAWWLRHRVRV